MVFRLSCYLCVYQVKAKSKNMIMLKAAKQSVRLEQEYEKLDESWDSVLLNLVKHERNVRDERDVRLVCCIHDKWLMAFLL